MSEQSEAEISSTSLCFLRTLTILVALVVLGFLVHAASGLLG